MGGTQVLKTTGTIIATGSRANRLPMIPFDLPGAPKMLSEQRLCKQRQCSRSELHVTSFCLKLVDFVDTSKNQRVKSPSERRVWLRHLGRDWLHPKEHGGPRWWNNRRVIDHVPFKQECERPNFKAWCPDKKVIFLSSPRQASNMPTFSRRWERRPMKWTSLKHLKPARTVAPCGIRLLWSSSWTKYCRWWM